MPKGFGPLIAVGVLGILLVIFALPISRWIASNRATNDGVVIGRIVRAEGSVRRIHGPDIQLIPSPVATPIELRDGDRLQTSVQSKVIIVLNSQDEFEIPQGSAVQFQLWNSKDPNSPIYIDDMLGNPQLTHPGIKGKAYLVKEGRLYFPGQMPLQKPLSLTVLHNAPLDMHLAETPASGQEFDNDNSEEPSAPAPPLGAEPDTLSNEYIDETIVGHQAQLQKCWLSRIKESPNQKGQIVVQFEISKRGKVHEARVADATLEDETLQKCVVSVIERISFRPYKGADISLSYPINFE